MNAIATPAESLVALRPVAEAVVSETRRIVGMQFGPLVRAVVLTGSMARQEETVIESCGISHVLGDAEFFLIFPRRPSAALAERVRATARSIAAALEQQGIRCHIDLAAVSASCLKNLPRHIFSYELRHNGRVALGDPGVLRLAPQFSASEIDHEDAWRLLSNRIVEWLEAFSRVCFEQTEPESSLYGSTVKLLLDSATSLLVFLGAYEPTYRLRADRLAALPSKREVISGLPVRIEEFAATVTLATQWKLSPNCDIFRQQQSQPFYEQVRRIALQIWRWELGQLTGLDPAIPAFELIQALSRRGNFARRYRGWLRAVRELGWFASRRNWPRWLRLARRGSSRDWIYAVAAECVAFDDLFLTLHLDNVSWRKRVEVLQQYLPVSHTLETGDRWRALLRDLAWNYHEFVERTRA